MWCIADRRRRRPLYINSASSTSSSTTAGLSYLPNTPPRRSTSSPIPLTHVPTSFFTTTVDLLPNFAGAPPSTRTSHSRDRANHSGSRESLKIDVSLSAEDSQYRALRPANSCGDIFSLPVSGNGGPFCAHKLFVFGHVYRIFS